MKASPINHRGGQGISTQDYMLYAADQMKDAGGVTYRKMFGEYGVYRDGRMFALVCDDRLFVKPTEAGRKLLGTPEVGQPFPGASDWFIIDDLDDPEALCALVKATCAELPAPKPKKQRKKKEK